MEYDSDFCPASIWQNDAFSGNCARVFVELTHDQESHILLSIYDARGVEDPLVPLPYKPLRCNGNCCVAGRYCLHQCPIPEPIRWHIASRCSYCGGKISWAVVTHIKCI